MPKAWLYMFALALPFIFRVLLVDLSAHNFLWYQGYEHAYDIFSRLSVNQVFLDIIGNWGLPAFLVVVISYWMIDYDEDAINAQFLITPLGYTVFALIGTAVKDMGINDWHIFINYPLIIIPLGYMYIFLWVILAWILEKIGLVASH